VSNLIPWLTKRRERFYTGEALQSNINAFLEMVADGAKVHEFDDAIIVLEDYGLGDSVRAWLLFDTFSRNVVRAMSKVTKEFKGSELYASTHDSRIRDLLLRMGYTQYDQDANDFWLVKQGERNGM
jgi:hypothetical protein